METIETVDEHCSHDDCIYRFRLSSYRCDFCNYCVVTGELRGCKISECTRYVKGRKRAKMTDAGLWFEWLFENEDD